MNEIKRFEVNETWAHSGIIKAGDFCFLSYCVGNIGGTIEQQINGAFDVMEERLALMELTLENVVHMDCLFKNIWNIPVMEKVIKEDNSIYEKILNLLSLEQSEKVMIQSASPILSFPELEIRQHQRRVIQNGEETSLTRLEIQSPSISCFQSRNCAYKGTNI